MFLFECNFFLSIITEKFFLLPLPSFLSYVRATLSEVSHLSHSDVSLSHLKHENMTLIHVKVHSIKITAQLSAQRCYNMAA